MPRYTRTVEQMMFLAENNRTLDVFATVKLEGSRRELGDLFEKLRDDMGAYNPEGTKFSRGVAIDPITGDLLLSGSQGVLRAKVGEYLIKSMITNEWYPATVEWFDECYKVIRTDLTGVRV